MSMVVVVMVSQPSGTAQAPTVLLRSRIIRVGTVPIATTYYATRTYHAASATDSNWRAGRAGHSGRVGICSVVKEILDDFDRTA